MKPRLVPVLLLSICFLFQSVTAQQPERWTSGEIYEHISKLRVLGSALYVAAHPDDENTRLISHLANDLKVHTTYLSVTRGDGGQNLVGPELGELLGVIRTQELLQARRIDDGHQRFTRALDFGYSKTPEETLEIWNKEEVLGDVVWVIRNVQPDIIVNRFKADPTPGNHGHHVASAMLSAEAFGLTAREDVYPAQLQHVSTWQPSRVFFNTSWWFYGSRENFEKADKSNMVTVDVGGYNPVTGVSNSEIAAESRSMHKSQGFGSSGTRGTEHEYLELVRGEMPSSGDLFEGINTTWSRLPGAAHIDGMIARIEEGFDFRHPGLSVPALLEVRNEIMKLSKSVWRMRKLSEIEQIITQCMGLYLEADASVYHGTAGDSITINFEVINRSAVSAELLGIRFEDQDLSTAGVLPDNGKISAMRKILIPEGRKNTGPYWLEESPVKGSFVVDDQLLRGLPETPHAAEITFRVRIASDTIEMQVPVIYKETDPVDGEVYRPFEIVPPLFVNIHSPAYIFTQGNAETVGVTVRAAKTNVTAKVSLSVPEGWTVTPPEFSVNITEPGDERYFFFQVKPGGNVQEGKMVAKVEADGKTYDRMLTELMYDHIPAQTVLREAKARVAHTDLRHGVQRIAYIQGAGDDIPAHLSQVGYQVEEITPEGITSVEVLDAFDAVVLGIRAYNTLDRLPNVQNRLFAYVMNGGTVITQYNTTHGLQDAKLAPYPIKLSRGRVTEEGSEVVFLAPDHPALNTPNKLTPADFDGWVQERGLYFPESWDPAYTPLLGMADSGEDTLNGSLLVAPHGKGYFVYTGISFFRQLPEGVPGAYRLFANLLALGQNGKS